MKRATAGPDSGQPFTSDMVNAPRFWARVHKGDGCWEWQGGRHKTSGYGVTGVRKFRRGPVHTHRVAYVLTHGSIARGLCVLHTCDNPPCCNPSHLRLGTQGDNMADARAKGRTGGLRKTHCKYGHLLPAPAANGYRCCGVCAAQHTAFWNEEKHERTMEIGIAEAQAHFREHIAPRLPASFTDLIDLTDPRRAEIVARSFGCYGFAPCLLQEIATEKGITRERVRQLRNHALLRIGVSEQAIHEIPRRFAWKEKAA